MAYPFIFEVLIVLAAAVTAGELFEQFRMPSVAGELLSGIILGPTILGVVSFTSDLQAFSTIALFFIIFLIGLEMNTETLWKHVRPAFLLAFTSFILPLFLAFVVAAFALPFGRASDFLVALAIAVPSISIISVFVMEYEMLEKASGQIILSTVVVADLVAFVLLAAASSPVPSTLDVVTYLAIFIAAFVLVDWVLNTRPLAVKNALSRVGRMSRGEDLAYAVLILVGLAVASIFQVIGLSYIIGAYFAGLIVHDGLIGRKAFREVSQTLARMNRAIFIPFFFGFAGLEADLSSSSYGLLRGDYRGRRGLDYPRYGAHILQRQAAAPSRRPRRPKADCVDARGKGGRRHSDFFGCPGRWNHHRLRLFRDCDWHPCYSLLIVPLLLGGKGVAE